jgi:nucleoid-associated protein YgaU
MQSYDDIEVHGFYDVYPDTAGLFSSIGKAFKSVGKAVGKPLAKVAKVVAAPIVLPTKAIGKAVSHVPVLGTIVNAANSIALGPINMTQAVLEGERIDKAALNNLKQNLAAVKTLAPYVQTVISFVPGIGTGVSAAIGAGLALAEGKNITDAMMAGVRGALPGGPAAAAAFDVAKAAIERKPLNQIALAALPLPPQQKALLAQGMNAVRDIAAGKNVAKSIVDNAVKALPPEYAKAVQIGLAMGHAKNLQEALKTGAKAAINAAAPAAIKSLPPSVTNIVNSVAKGAPLSPASVAELAKHKITPAAVLTLAKKNLPTKVIGVNNPMRAPNFLRAGSIPVIALQRNLTRISAVPSATEAVVRAVTKNPALMASSRQLLAQGMRTNAASVNDAMAILSRKKGGLLPWRSMPPHVVSFIRKYAPNAPLTALRHAHTNVGGLDSTGTTYIVEKGDGPWAIAQKLTGNGNRWKELLDYNKDKNPKIDKNVWVGEVINLPPSWQKPVAAKPPTAVALPSVPAPTIAPVPDLISQATQATSVVPSILQAKAILAAWGKTDGVNQAGLTDYGLNPADMSTTMGPRDTMMLQSFQVWDNKTLNEGLPTDGNLDAKSLAALQNWASARATAAVPSAPITTNPGAVPTVSPGSPLPQPPLPAVTVTVPDVIGGTAPTVTVTPKPATPASPTPAVSSKPAGSGAAIAIGAVAGGLLFGVPGAIIGAAGGAAIS